MRKLITLLVVLAVSGCSADATEPKQAKPVEDVASTSTPAPSTPTAGVSTALPTRPYLLKGRLHVGREVMPGRYAGVIVRGKTWLGWKRWDGPRTWGTDTTAHRLPAVNAVELSSGGRFIATIGGGEHCEGVGLNREGRPCTVRLLDTSGAEAPRRLVARTDGLVGVSDQGVVVLTEGADDLVWDATGGADRLVPIEDSPGMREWAMHDWEPGSFGNAGFEFFAPNVSQRWLGELVDGQVRARFRIPQDIELGPGGAWVLGNPWARGNWRNLKGALEPTTRTLRARSLGKHGEFGSPVLLRAPAGWSFARGPLPGDVVFWEDADTFVARVVDARQGGDRLARCDIPLATCVPVVD